MTKTCKLCERNLPLGAYTRHPTAALGVRPECKECMNRKQRAAHAAASGHSPKRKEQMRAWQAAHLDRGREHARRWREANPEKAKEWARANPEKVRAYGRASEAKHKERRQAKNAAWLAANPHMRAIYSQARRARRLGAPGRYTQDDVLHMRAAQDGACYYCDADMGERYTVDHRIPLSRTELNPSNWPENLCLCCQPCNSSKHNSTEWEFRARLEKEAAA